MEQYILEAEGLGKKYSRFELKPLDFRIPGGCIVGLIGENGAGKSTLMKCLLNIARRTSGEVRIFGQELDGNEQRIKKQLGVVFGDQSFPLTFRAKEVARVMEGIFEEWDQPVFEGFLERFHLDESQPVKDYSRGMRMKLNLAAAMSHHARLLILDEPASGLDPLVREELLDLLREFVEDEEHSVLISSHIISDLEKISDYAALLHRGELKLLEEKDALLENYAVLKCEASQMKELDPAAVIGSRMGTFGAEVLIRRELLPRGAAWEPASLEQILIFHGKEGL